MSENRTEGYILNWSYTSDWSTIDTIQRYEVYEDRADCIERRDEIMKADEDDDLKLVDMTMSVLVWTTEHYDTVIKPGDISLLATIFSTYIEDCISTSPEEEAAEVAGLLERLLCLATPRHSSDSDREVSEF